MLEMKDTRKQVEFYFVICIVLSAVTYGLFRAYPLVVGPKITIVNLKDGDTVPDTTFTLSGNVVRAREITLQGKPITIDDHGDFKETLVAAPPYTILVLVATDKYGATETKTLRVIPK
jgi:hypothetical protein